MDSRTNICNFITLKILPHPAIHIWASTTTSSTAEFNCLPVRMARLRIPVERKNVSSCY